MTKLCDECETVAHCLKHGCIPKQTALDKKAENARELGLDYELAPGYCKQCKQYSIEEPLPAAQRQWVGLTDEEVGDLSDFAYANDEEFVRNVEAKLKERNV